MYIIYDTETTGLPKSWNAPLSDSDNWPRLVQLAWQLHDGSGKLLNRGNLIAYPDGYNIPFTAAKVHGITTERAQKEGIPLDEVLDQFLVDLNKAEYVVGHNISFDINIVGAELIRKNRNETILTDKKYIDTKDESTDYCAIPGGRGGKFKWPTLTELHTKLFGEGFGDAHDAAYDVDATAKCFFGLVTEGVIPPKDGRDKKTIQYEAPVLTGGNFQAETKKNDLSLKKNTKSDVDLSEYPFVHLHAHSQYSILQSTSEVASLAAKAKELEMPAIALTDHGNMMGAFHFVKAASNAGITPIVGCEFFVCSDRLDKSKQNNGHQILLLAKNKNGYQNLTKLASYAYTQGFYYVPRIDKSLVQIYKKDLIATTGGLWGEVPDLILNYGEAQAEEAFLWWKEEFGDDFYAEIQRHGLEEEKIVNETLLRFCEKHNVKYFASNNVYYTNKEDAKAHDVLLCVKDAESVHKPKKYYGRRGKEYRFGFPNDEFYIKTADEMKSLFADIPEAIITIKEILEKIEAFKLSRDVLLPKFDIPEEFQDPEDLVNEKLKNGENSYLRHLTYEGAMKRYGVLTPEIQERLDFELQVIRNTGYPGYFLIVEDFIRAARSMGVSVGPGRGSAAGSAVAYCIGITNVDPIKYDLLFERFLNPDRVSMPDIDIDFDDEGRGKVIDYVINKYGASQVAQIITYGTMAAKSSIRDTARVMELPLAEADKIAKLVPDIKLSKLFSLDDKGLADKLKNNADEIFKANELKNISKGFTLDAQVLNQARVLEGSVRNTGIHACGVIITPDDITNFVPVALAKDSEMYCTQFDNSVVESAGLLKMDFLGLKTLTLIKDACRIVKERHGIDLDPDTFPVDDTLTYELFQRGETVGIFQYESPGMQKYMRELKPTVFADLIAMNALYRPGPLEYIPSFIRRKHGHEPITYDIDASSEYLEETYGITVYQEQVMLLSQKLAGFTKGEADMLRKAMGKKQKDIIDKMQPKFIEGGTKNGHDEKALLKVWKDWEAFASYAFNKSHSTCYAWIAYQTAYLKAHYPAEYMASVLSNNMNDIKQVTFFMEECKRMGVPVLGPDVNESNAKFTVNKEGAIRFGLGAIKGSGDAAVEAIVSERTKKGPFKDIFDFAERVNLRQVNKKTFEVLAMSGGFDSFTDYHRRQYLEAAEGDIPLIEKVIKYANKMDAEKSSAQASLFGASDIAVPKPRVDALEPYGNIQKLNIEKEVVGLFITGHPLDQFKLEIEHFTSSNTKSYKQQKDQDVSIGGIITNARRGQAKNGKPYCIVTLEDYEGSVDMFLMGESFIKNQHYFSPGEFVFVKGKVELNYRKKNEMKDNPHVVPTDDDYEFSPYYFELLADVREKLCKGVKLSLELESLDSGVIEMLEMICQENPGTHDFRINVVDSKKGLDISMFSRKYKINTTSEMIREFEKIENSRIKILT